MPNRVTLFIRLFDARIPRIGRSNTRIPGGSMLNRCEVGGTSPTREARPGDLEVNMTGKAIEYLSFDLGVPMQYMAVVAMVTPLRTPSRGD